MNKRKLAVIMTSLAIGAIGVGTTHINHNIKNESAILLAGHSSVMNYISSGRNRDRAWDEAVRLHGGDRKNNCTFYVSSLLRGAGYNVPSYIGYTTDLGDWLGNHGWTRKTNLNDLKPGDICFAGDTHAVVFLSWADKDKHIANVNDEQVVSYNNGESYPRRLQGAHGNGFIPGEGNSTSYMRITYYMSRNNDNSSDYSGITGVTTIKSSIGWLNFRSGNSTSYGVISRIPTGITVDVLGQENGWYKVKYNGQEGWISGNYTTGITEKTTDDNTYQGGGSSVVTDSQTTIKSSIGWLNFRSGNSTSYRVISRIPTGTTVDVLGQENGWYKVKYNGQEGWVSGDYTNGIMKKDGGQGEGSNIDKGDNSIISDAQATIKSSIGWLNFRKGNNTGYDVISRIPTGTTVSVLGQENGWYKVSYNGEIGWISGNYTTGLIQNDKSSDFGTTTIQSSIGWLRLRAGAGTGYGVLGKMPTGARVKVLSKIGGWYKVNYNGQIGWCYSGYTTGI